MNKENTPCFTVTEVTNAIKTLIEDSLPCVWVKGEVSQIKKYPSGHWYFTIKDENATLNSVVWSSFTTKIEHIPSDGEEIEAYGKLHVYAQKGAYNLVVYDIKKSGKGNIFEMLEKLKQKLFDEGLFDESKKRAITKYPQTIAIITGKDSAALKDMLAVANQKYPLVRIKVFYSLVQGAENYKQVITAMDNVLEYSKTKEKIDIVVLARGGGSVEDLWIFNDERLARHISKFPIPVVTGIGHESDTTIADLVADKRCSTPTAAISFILPNINEFNDSLRAMNKKLYEKMALKINESKMALDYYYAVFTKEKLIAHFENKKLILSGVCDKIRFVLKTNVAVLSAKVDRYENVFSASSPQKMLQKGFSLVLDENGNIIKKAKNVEIGSDIKVILDSGSLISTVKQKGV